MILLLGPLIQWTTEEMMRVKEITWFLPFSIGVLNINLKYRKKTTEPLRKIVYFSPYVHCRWGLC